MEPEETKRPDPFGPGVARMLSGGVRPGEAAQTRPAATVVVLRDTDSGIETFMVQRASRLKFMGGAYVFPGGRVDRSDPNPEAAAVRETEEEIRVKLDVRHLHPWSRWITPVIEPKRFDARFFVAGCPAGQVAEAVLGEVTSGMWIAPEEALQKAADGSIVLPPPTLWTLLELGSCTRVAEVIAAAAGRDHHTPFQPRALELPGGELALLLRGDPCYDDPAASPTEDAQRRFILRDGRWLVYGGPR